MLQFALLLLGLIVVAPIAIPVGIAILGISLVCFGITVFAIGVAFGWVVSKAAVWLFLDRLIEWIPFLLDRERNTAHERVNVFFGYSHDCHNSARAPPAATPTTRLKPHLTNGMTSQEWLGRKASIGSLSTFQTHDFENTDSWANEDDDSEALYMARRNSLVQPSFDSPTFDCSPRSQRASRSGSPEISRPQSRAPTPSMYTAFADSMRPPSRNGSGFFGSTPATLFRGIPGTPVTETQYFQLPQTTSPISLHGRRPSWSPIIHRRNNQSTTSFGSVPEEMTEFRTYGANDETRS